MTLRTLQKISALFLFSFALMAACYAGEKDQDIYAPVYTQPLAPEPLKGTLSRILEFPLQVAKWPMDQGLLFNDKHQIDKKAKWIYEETLRQGFKPLFGFSDLSMLPYYGAELNLLALARQKEKFPDFFATATIMHCPGVFFLVGTEIGAQQIGGTGFHAKGLFNYDLEEKEPFYGIGPDTSKGEKASYRIETTQVGVESGYEFSPRVDLIGAFDYKNVNVLNRVHDDTASIPGLFPGQNIQGLSGDNLLDYSVALKRDTRDSKDDATQGSYQKLLFQYTDGVNGSPAQYFKYQLDMAKYFRLWSPRRIFVARLFGEHNAELNHGTIPFYNLARLGGAGGNTRDSETMRGYSYNRFYGESALLLNLEYRYTVMEYKEFKGKVALFNDLGQVFGEIHQFDIADFRESYGVGFYLSYARNTLLNFSVAHSNDGTQFYIKNKLAF